MEGGGGSVWGGGGAVAGEAWESIWKRLWDGRAGVKLEVGRLQESGALGGPSCRIGAEWS